MKFTDHQQRAIQVNDRDLILSAGAGAGKTAVLIEKVYHLLSSGEEPCSLDELLIVTFSRAATTEMKSRLAQRLRGALQEESLRPDLQRHLEEQLYNLPRAPISTIHSFCLTVIGAFPEEAEIAPGFDMMSEEEARLYHRDFYETKLEETLEREDATGKAFRALMEQLDPVRARGQLLGYLLDFHNFLQGIPRHEEFAEKCRAMPSAPEGENHPANSLIRQYLLEKAAEARSVLACALSFPQDQLNRRYADVYTVFKEIDRTLERFSESRDPDGELAGAAEKMKPPRLSSKGNKDDGELDDRFEAYRKKANDAVKATGALFERFAPEYRKADLASAAGLVNALVDEVILSWEPELFRQHCELRRLTFAHLEKIALKILLSPEGEATDAARILRQQYRHILVDEYQDVNDVQESILTAIARPPGTGRGGNLFVVGDVKQSIYEFRQADPTLFLDRYTRSPDFVPRLDPGEGARLSLPENFRSHDALLREFNQLFFRLLQKDTIGLDYTGSQQFTPGTRPENPDRRAAGLEFHVLPKEVSSQDNQDEEEEDSEEREARYTAEMIQRLGPPWRDICVLLRSKTSVPALLEALSVAGVPAYCDARIGFLSAVEVLEFQALLKAIYNPFDELALLAALRGPAGRWSEEELLELRLVDRRGLLINNLRAVARDSNSPIADRSARFLESLEHWQHESRRRSMADFFSLLYNELHLLESASVRPGGDQRKLNLLHLQRQAREFDRFHYKGLGKFLQFLEDLIANDQDISPPSPLPEDADVVQIMSIHKSKGMQFPIVVCPFLGREFNPAGLNRPFLFDRRHGIAPKFRDVKEPGENPVLYDVFRHLQKNRERGEDLRLLYVALTRAQEAAYLVGSTKAPAATFLEHQNRITAGRPSAVDVLSAKCFLDWVLGHAASRLPVVTEKEDGLEAKDGLAAFRLYETAPPPEQQDQEGDDKRRKPSAEELAPYHAASERIEALWTQEEAAQVRAKISVSEAKRAYDALRDAETPPLHLKSKSSKGRIDWLPNILKPSAAKKSGTERGRAVHRFLALCGLERLSRGEVRLSDEVDRLQKEGLLTAEWAEAIDLEEIAWFLNGDLGKRVRSKIGILHRERPFTVRIATKELGIAGEEGSVILQGVVDLLFEEEDGWILIDYKTDYCGPDGGKAEELARSYEPQIQLYRLAVGRALGVSVKESWLVFLQGRRAIACEETADPAAAWARVVEAGAVIYTEPERRTNQSIQI